MHDDCSYSHLPCTKKLRTGLECSLRKKPDATLAATDIVLLNVQGRAQHLGIIAPYALDEGWSIIHAYAPARKVVEHRMDACWKKAIAEVYGLPEFKIPCGHEYQ